TLTTDIWSLPSSRCQCISSRASLASCAALIVCPRACVTSEVNAIATRRPSRLACTRPTKGPSNPADLVGNQGCQCFRALACVTKPLLVLRPRQHVRTRARVLQLPHGEAHLS